MMIKNICMKMRQYSISVQSLNTPNKFHYLLEYNENETTAVMGFQTNFPCKSSFPAESKYAPRA